MNIKYKKRKGSITIIALYIFILILTSSTILLYFATLQASLSKNQLEKIQSRYKGEDNLNIFVYGKDNIDKYLQKHIFRTYRTEFVPYGGLYDIKLEKNDKLKKEIGRISFRLEDINGRKNIIISMDSKHGNIKSNTVGSGPCISKIFELKKPCIFEKDLSFSEKELFSEFMYQMEHENTEYDCKLDFNSIKINTNKDMFLELENYSHRGNKIYSEKKFIIKSDQGQETFKCTNQSILLNIKRGNEEEKILTIGDIDNNNLIKLNGVLYIEGDLIINQDFELSGIIIINKGNIIVNSPNKPKINGVVYYRGENINKEDMVINYDQNAIYKEASFLPGFINIELDTIRRY